MLDHGLDGGAGFAKIQTRIEVRGLFNKVLTDAGSKSKAQIGVDVNLADSHGSGLAELLFRNADSIGHLSAVLVDDLHKFLRYRGCTMQNDREARQTLGDFLQYVKAKGRRDQDAICIAGALFSRELVSAMGCADGDSQ